ncbi:MAG: hypothetical protein CSA38_03215 [Flavobacteriales bacterium]|nr:MAG: hypothetical protein CSA38_03215 [Flavobacteriales bacterium]
MKKSLLILLINCFALLWGQSSFDYTRTWGTYYGPNLSIANGGGEGYFANYNSTLLIHGDNIYTHFMGKNLLNNTYANFSTSYYNQFITEGDLFDADEEKYEMQVVFNTTGEVEKSLYTPSDTTSFLFRIDQQGNRYYLDCNNNVIGTPNTWFATSPLQENNKINISLIKKNANNEILWRTFLPKNIANNFSLNQIRYIHNIKSCFDEEGNIYLASVTSVQNGISTSGAFQENFTPCDNNKNLFVVKLNPQGQLVWGTYIPTEYGFDIGYYDNGVYILHGKELDNSPIPLATSKTFQQEVAVSGIMKLNANTGERIWGTYYGTTETTGIGGITHKMNVNETGIYVFGNIYTSQSSTYFGTPNTHKPIGDAADIIIAKFNDRGQRIWGTYLGTPVGEWIDGNSVVGNKIFISGHTNSNDNISTLGAYQEEIPGGYYKDFFAELNGDNGQLKWCSYIGKISTPPGATKNFTEIKAINENTFYLIGKSENVDNIASAGAVQTQVFPEFNNTDRAFYIMRFDKEGLSTTETDALKDLVLYNNPNNGNFSIKGSVLQKRKSQMQIYDTSGRLVFSESLPKQPIHRFHLQNLLTQGHYLLKISQENEIIKTFKMLVN